MEDIEQRLRTATDTCISCYNSWSKDHKNTDARGTLMEAVHELRKIAARLEIEIATSERDEMAARPIPIPAHRSQRKQTGHDEFSYDDNIGNTMPEDDGPQPQSNSGSHRPSGGGGQRRRPHQRSGGGGGRSRSDNDGNSGQ